MGGIWELIGILNLVVPLWLFKTWRIFLEEIIKLLLYNLISLEKKVYLYLSPKRYLH